MHDLSFRFKRAHLKAVAFGRALLRKFGLTPARFDVLYVVQRGGPYGLKQSDIWEILGLHKSTISKMCKRLEELGLIRRCHAATGHHELAVQLTADGIERLGMAMNFVFRTEGPRFAMGVVMSRIEPDVEAFIAKLRWLTERAARNLGDTSTLLYPLKRVGAAMLDKVFKRIQSIGRARWEEVEQAKTLAERQEAHMKFLREKRARADDTSGWDPDDFEH